MSHTHAITAICAALLLTACGPDAPDEAPAKRASQLGCKPSDVSEQTFAVMRALEPSCAGCHSAGPRGYFQSAAAFQSLLASDTALVKPGDADGSELIRLLEGRGTGAFTSMPIGVKSYAQLAEEDDTMMPMSELRAWVNGLGQQVRDARPDRDASRIRRMSALQMKRALYLQLGLKDDDFFGTAYSYEVPMLNPRNEGNYPIRSLDELPAPYERVSSERFTALGGGSALAQIPGDTSVSPTTALTLTQVSQAWCRLALKKADNTALFSGASTREDTDPAAVQATILRWSLQFWGERMDQAQAETLYNDVFVPLSAASAEPAYVGVCSYFIRHPRWVFY
jgi:hypothetical protein